MELKEVILVCDLCKKQEGEGVDTHVIELDGKRVELEWCDACGKKFPGMTKALAAGRRIPKKAKRA